MEKKLSELPYDINLLNRYRKALDSAVKIATRYNVKPIPGKTMLACCVDGKMDRPCTSARGLGKPKTLLEVGILLGLMFKYSCEDCTMIIYAGQCHSAVDLESGTILQNMDSVISQAQILQSGMSGQGLNPAEMLRDRTELDNLVILGDESEADLSVMNVMPEFLSKYRHVVNRNLLFVNVRLGGATSAPSTPKHPNDIYIAGFSDQILRFVAERGDTGQVTHVQNIDKAYNLNVKVSTGRKMAAAITKQPSPLVPRELTRKHHNLRVFISSTFRDMHGERDLLTRFVFPELRAMARTRFVNLYEVDLRWGVSEEQTKNNSSVEICLREANRCDLFLGIVGDRYGYMPAAYPDLGDDPDFDWLSSHPKGRSVTELEMYHKALKFTDAEGKAFFFIRDSDFVQDLPKKLRSQFVDDSDERKEKVQNLKDTIRRSGHEVFDGYPCKFGGIVEGKAVVVSLEEFGRRVIHNIWNYIKLKYPQDGEFLDEVTHERAQHDMFLQSQLATFTGRRKDLKQIMETVQKTESGLILVSGKQGCGKTALMASVADTIQTKTSKTSVLVHFIGAVPGSSNAASLLKRFCNELIRRCGLRKQVPEEYKNLVSEFPHLLEEAATQFDASNKLVIVVDGVSNMDPAYQAHNLDWLPHNIPQNVIFVLSAVNGTPAHGAAVRRQATVVEVGPLDLMDKAEVVRKTLAAHHKTLDESPFNNQMKLLVSKREANLPLFLRLACEELRVFGVFEEVSARLKAMSHTVASLLQEVLKRLEDDHGVDLVSTALASLVSTRDGIYEEDLHHLLSIHSKLAGTKYTYSAVKGTRLGPGALLPHAFMARLVRGIRSLLAPTGEHGDQRLKVSHGQISQAIAQRYMKGAASELQTRVHALLAGFLTQLAQSGDNKEHSWSTGHTHALTELPYHLIQAGLFKDLLNIVTDPFYIQAKCMVGLTSTLLEDLQVETSTTSKSILREREKFISNPLVCSLRSFISRHLHILNLCPALLWQQALNEPDASLVRRAMLECGGCEGRGVVAWKNKKESDEECLLTLTGFSQAVLCVAISPGDQYFAVGTKDCQLKLYEMATGKEVRSFTGHSDAVTSCSFVGRSRLVSAARDKTLSLWDVDQGYRVSILKGHRGLVSCCITDPKGVDIASCGWDCRVLIWDGRSGKQTADITEARPISCLSYHPEGKLLVTGSWDSTIKIWDIFNKKRMGILRGHRSSVRAVTYSPTGRHIASASLDGAVKLWSADTGTQVGSLCGHSQPINHIAYSHNGRELVTVSNDQKIKVWSGNLGKQLATFHSQGEKNAATQSVFSPDGCLVAVGYHSGEVRVVEARSRGQEVFSYRHRESRVRGVAWCGGGGPRTSLLVGYESGHAVIICQVSSEKPVVVELRTNRAPVSDVAFSEAAKTAVICYENMSVALWYNPKVDDSGDQSGLNPTSVFHPPCNGVITCCAFNSTGSKLVLGTRDAMLFVYDIKGGKTQSKDPTLRLDNCHKDWINACAWSSGTDFIATASNDSTIKLWDMKSGKVKAHLKGHQSAVYSVAFSHGCIVSGSLDGSVKVWTHRGVEITTLYGHSTKVNRVDIHVPLTESGDDDLKLDDEDDIPAASTGGNWADMMAEEDWKEQHEKKKLDKVSSIKLEEFVIASASDDGTAQLWKPLQVSDWSSLVGANSNSTHYSDGNELTTLTGHSDRVMSVAVAASGQLVTTSMDCTVKVWKPELSPDAAQLGAHSAEVVAVALSTKTSFAITTSRNGSVSLWQLNGSNTDTNRSLTLAYSWKLAESRANAACFIGKHTSFVLGLDDGSISTWKIQEMKDKPGVYTTVETKKLNLDVAVWKTMPSPVTCLKYNQAKDVLHVGTWVSVVTISNLGTRKLKKSTYPSTDWVLELELNQNGNLVASLADGTVVYPGRADGLVVDVGQALECPMVPWQYSLAVAPQEMRSDSGTKYLTGNSQGMLMSVVQHHEKMLLQSLKAPVMSLGITQRHVVSAQGDGTVRLWDKESFTQVGQFFCPSPVTAMSTLSESSDTILCGDQLGFLYLLEWKQ